MSTRTQRILALLAALVVAGGALPGDAGCCDDLCCDLPCVPTATGFGPCTCCVYSGPMGDGPGLPAAPAATAAPSLSATTTPVADPLVAPSTAPAIVATTPDPPPSRPTVLRI